MCQIVSLAVNPVTAEVFHSPGVWHHSELCQKLGLEYTEVFKPEFHLNTRSIEFPEAEQKLAFKRRLPEDLKGEIMTLLHTHGMNATDFEASFCHQWSRKHLVACQLWIAEHCSSVGQLLDFSQHTWNPVHYKGTVSARCEFSQALSEIPAYQLEGDRTSRLLRAQWQIDFSRLSTRGNAWLSADTDRKLVRVGTRAIA